LLKTGKREIIFPLQKGKGIRQEFNNYLGMALSSLGTWHGLQTSPLWHREISITFGTTYVESTVAFTPASLTVGTINTAPYLLQSEFV
jgi:hypothetical protein